MVMLLMIMLMMVMVIAMLLTDLDKNVQRSVFGIPGVLDLRLPVTDGNSEEDE